MAQCSHWSLTQIRLLLIIQLVVYVKVGYLLTFTMGQEPWWAKNWHNKHYKKNRSRKSWSPV